MTVSVETTPEQANEKPSGEVLRPHAEDAFADELAALAAQDDRPRPVRWKMSPWAVVLRGQRGEFTGEGVLGMRPQRLVRLLLLRFHGRRFDRHSHG